MKLTIAVSIVQGTESGVARRSHPNKVKRKAKVRPKITQYLFALLLALIM